MRSWVKVSLVGAGYVAAFLIASAVAAAWAAVTSGSDGMVAFGESLLFLGVFGVAAVPATGAALFFLRPYPAFWRALAVIAMCIAATGAAAVIIFIVGRSAVVSALAIWAAFAVIRILIAPCLPERSSSPVSLPRCARPGSRFSRPARWRPRSSASAR